MALPIIEIGKYNTLEILKSTPQGLYVGDTVEEILLPNKYIPENATIGDDLEVFIYIDGEDRLIATTLKPYAQRDEFAYLKVKSVSSVGAFLDWGLEKDLFVPFKEQQTRMEEGASYLVYIYLDDLTDRLVASSNINRFLELDEITYEENDEVSILIGPENELGYQCIIDERCKGLLYKNEIFRNVKPGDHSTAYIKQVRPDNKIDLALEKPGMEKIDEFAQKVLQVLKQNEGSLSLHDKSDPDAIKKTLQMSKKNFKKAIGALYKKRLINIHDKGITLQ